MSSHKGLGLLAVVAALGALLALHPGAGLGLGTPPAIERISVSTGGVEGDMASAFASVSGDGVYVAFSSDASTLVPNDTNDLRDVFVHNRLTGITTRISLTNGGGQVMAYSGGTYGAPALSDDGRYVAFASQGGDLVPNDGNFVEDAFVRDRVAGTTERVSVNSAGVEGDNETLTPWISGNGRYVTFSSVARNLVPNDQNNIWDVFLHDRETHTTELVSLATDGTYGNGSSGFLGAGAARISDDGRYVVYGSFSDNLAPNDHNHVDDIFLRDRVAGTTERVSISTAGVEGNDHSTYADVSDDGRYVVFSSLAENLVPDDNNGLQDIFLRDRLLGTTIRIQGAEQPNRTSRLPTISGDGSVVVFESEDTNMVPTGNNNTTNVYKYTVATGQIERVSMPAGGGIPNARSSQSEVNADGSVIVFASDASNLGPPDGNMIRDIYAWGKPLRVPPTPAPTHTPAPTPTPSPTPPLPNGDVSGDGVTNSVDGLFVLQYSAALLSTLPRPGNADVNLDGNVTSVDATLILQFDARLIPSLPV